jgi:DNA-binding beta-propeller fold protein YncE
MRTMRWTVSAPVAAVLLLVGGLTAAAQPKWEVKKTVHIGEPGGWDYAIVNSETHRLYLTRSTHTDVIDTATGKVVADIPGQIRSHGTALVPDLNRGFITDGGGSGRIIIFNLQTDKVIGSLATMPDSDGIIYDKAMNRVLAVSGDGATLMAFNPDIDPKSGKIEKIPLGGAPEFLAADNSGKVYVNLADKNLLAVVDLKAGKVIARWPTAPGGHPTGLALDVKTHTLFIGCRNPQKLIVMDADNGKILAALPIGAENDAVKLDGAQAFASCGDGTLTVAGKEGGKYVVEQVVKTREGARTMTVDRLTNTIYLPTAEPEAAAPGAPRPRRPRMKPDSFMLVEVGRE